MNLVLRVLTLNGQPLSQAIVGCFDLKGGTIGRSDTNTMTLPDPERHISRLQAQVMSQNDRFSVRNAASANAIFINGRTLGSGETCLLAHGDELRVGGYVLGVQIEADNEAVRTIVRGRAVVDARAVIVGSAAEHRTDPLRMGQRSDPFGDLLGSAPVADPNSAPVDPFAFLNAAPAAPAAPFAVPAPPPRAAPPARNPSPASDAPARLPDDFDPFADLAPPPSPASASPAAPQVGGNDLLGLVGAGSNASPSIDIAFGLAPAVNDGSDPLAAFLNPPAAMPGRPAASPTAASSDPFAMFGSPPASPPAAHAAFDHTPELKAAYRPPQVAAPPTPVRPAPTPAPAVSISQPPHAEAPDALWAAFCEGAGVQVELPRGLTAEQMRMLGSMLLATTEGTIRLMAVRATAKTELRAEVTTIRTRNNNPLKFSPNAQAALEQLLRPPLRGFMGGPAAMQDAMQDLLGHTIGTMAGMRAALAGVLGRFEPEALERKLSAKSMLDSLLPMNRKAKLWDLYLQHFGAIREEAQEDFDQLFGAAFVAAYEEELDRLHQASGGDG